MKMILLSAHNLLEQKITCIPHIKNSRHRYQRWWCTHAHVCVCVWPVVTLPSWPASGPLSLSKWNCLPSAAWTCQNSSKWRVSARSCATVYPSIPGMHVLTVLSRKGRRKPDPMLPAWTATVHDLTKCRLLMTNAHHGRQWSALSSANVSFERKKKNQEYGSCSLETVMPSQPWWDAH